MKHKRGNSPHCYECEHYRERLEGETLRGWCELEDDDDETD